MSDPVYWAKGGLLALAKPPGLPVFPPHADPAGDCLLARLLATHPAQGAAWPPGFAGGIAHRLDGPTSGQVLAARDRAALARLRALFAEHRLEKRYLFLTARDVPWDAHEVGTRIAHHPRRRSRMVVERGRNTPHRGRWAEARTVFRRLGSAGGLWLWEARMRTGVMHQIRLHAASVGLALAGDRLYGGGETPPGFPVPFALHHCGVVGPGVRPPPAPLPGWWPVRGPTG